MSKPDGGPAFPTDMERNGLLERHQGVTVRDYFAAKAMAALLSQMTLGNQGQMCAMYDPNDPGMATTLAHLSYQAADAMIAERDSE